MAIFGYIIYLVISVFASIIYMGVMSWAGGTNGEKLFMTSLTSALWYGAWYFFPFTVTII